MIRVRGGWELDVGPDGAVNIEKAQGVLARRVEDRMRARDQARAQRDASPYLRDWAARNSEQAAALIAIARERAVHDQEQELARAGLEGREPPSNARHIGVGDVAAIKARLRSERHARREAAGEPGAAVRIERDDVEVPRSLDRLEHLTGWYAMQMPRTHAAVLADVVEKQPDDVVRARHAELGAPDAGLDRIAALELGRIEVRRTAIREQTDAISLTAASGPAIVIEGRESAADWQAMAETAQARRHADELIRLDAVELRMHEDRVHPERWYARRYTNALAAAYADEVKLREEVERRQEAEREVVEPGPDILGLVGPQREGEWADVVREVVYRRLSQEAELRDGDMRPQGSREREEQRQLDQRIDRLRAEQNLPALERGLEADGPGFDA